MKKLVTLALAGVCALAFAATADAASALRMKAPTVKQGVTKTVGTATVQVNQVKTEYSQYAQDYARDNGGYFNVYSVWSDNILNSQTVYDDVKQALNKVGSQFSNIFPAIAQEATYVHAAQISSGSAKYNMTTQNAGTGYASVYNIAHYVIPGRVAALAQGTTEIDMSTENAPNGGVQGNSNGGRTFNSEEDAEKWVTAVRTAFNDIESENAQNVANKVSSLSNIYNKFLADQAATLAAAQKVYDDAVAARETAQSAYDAAVATREAKSDDYDSKKDVSAFENALTNAINDQNAKQGTYDEKVAAREAAEKALADALQAEAEALAALNDAIAEQEAADTDYQAKVQARKDKVGEAATALQAEKDAKAVLDNATVAQKAAQANYDAKVAAREAAEQVLATAQAEEKAAKTALDNAKDAKDEAQLALDNATNAVEAFDRAMREEGLADALDTAREAKDDAESDVKDAAEAVADALEAYEAAQQPTVTTVTEEVTQTVLDEDGNPVVDEEGNEVTQVVTVEKQVEVPADEAVVAAALVAYNEAVAAKDAADEASTAAKTAYDKALKAYEDGIAALDTEKARLDKAKGDAQLALESAIGAETAAQTDYDAKVSEKDAKAAELAEAQDAEAEALAALNDAKDAKVAAEKALADAKAAREAKDGEVVDAQAAEADALAALNAANGVQATAQAEYDAAVAVREGKATDLKNAQASEDRALTRLNKAIANREAAEQALADAKDAREKALAAFNNAKDAESSALAFLNNKKSEEADALAALEALKVKQANDNADKLANLKSQLTSYINGLKYVDDQTGDYGLKYNVNMIDGYDNLRFDQVVYQANSFTEPEYSLSSANKKDDKAIESIVSVSYRQQPYTMVDGVLQQVSYVDVNKYETSIYFQNGTKRISPLVLDITGNGVLQASNGQNMPGHDVVKENNIISDFFGDGFEIAMEWVGPQDGLLVAPKADGSVDMSCLFGTAGGYETGYEKLSLYDKNGDMKVNGEELNDLAIWQDANGNGIADAGEVKSVKSLGITSINVEFNKENFVSSFERNGQTYKMWDWWPNAVELVKLAAK